MIETRADLVKLLRETKDRGVPYDYLLRQGIVYPPAAAAGLIRAGYEVECKDKHMILISEPRIGNRRRKRQWMTLFDTEKDKPQSPYGREEREG